MFRNKRKLAEFAGSMCLSAVLFFIIYKFIPIVYSTNDDRMIAEIISGQFTGKPESYAIQMSYGFTWFLSKLYEITRSLNWYGIVLIGIQIFSFGAILYRLLSFSEKWVNKLLTVITAMGLFVAVWLEVYVQLTYTTTAAFAGMAAIFWYAASKTDWKNLLMAVILANLTFCIRPNVFYMFVPATGLVYLWKLMGKKELDKQTIAGPFMILAVTFVLFVVNASAYQKSGWKEFMEFFDARTDVYDYYDLLPYEEYPQLYEPYGISEEEYHQMRVYNYTVLGELPKEFFPEYIEACKALEKEQGVTFATKSVNAVKTFLGDGLTGAYGFANTALFLFAAVFFIFLILKRRYPLAIYLGIQYAAFCVLWLYFTYWGRAIGRIQISMSLIFLAVVLHAFCEFIREIDTENLRERALCYRWLALIAVILVIGVSKFTSYRHENIAKADWYRDVQKIKEYCAENPERLYYMDIATMTELYGNVTMKNTEPEYINYIALGDWSAYCPHYEEKLKNHGVSDVAESICDENTYVIMLHNYQLKCLKEYLNAEESWEETIFGANEVPYAVYRFKKQ